MTFLTPRDLARQLPMTRRGIAKWIERGWVVPDAFTSNGDALFSPSTAAEIVEFASKTGRGGMKDFNDRRRAEA